MFTNKYILDTSVNSNLARRSTPVVLNLEFFFHIDGRRFVLIFEPLYNPFLVCLHKFDFDIISNFCFIYIPTPVIIWHDVAYLLFMKELLKVQEDFILLNIKFFIKIQIWDSTINLVSFKNSWIQLSERDKIQKELLDKN